MRTITVYEKEKKFLHKYFHNQKHKNSKYQISAKDRL